METNTKTTIKNDKSIKLVKHDIFTLVKGEDKKVQIVIGDALITERKFSSFKYAKEFIDSKPYELIMNIACLSVELMLKFQNDEKKDN